MSQPPFQDQPPSQDAAEVSEPSAPLSPSEAVKQETIGPDVLLVPRKGKGVLLGLLGLVVSACVLALALFLFVLYATFTPIGPKVAPQTLVIAKGSSVSAIAHLLEDKNIVLSSILFRGASRFVAEDRLHAGEYQFLPAQNLLDIVIMMRDGLSVVRRFTVPEGLTSAEIVDLLKNDPALSGEIDRIPEEGSLWPETYHYSYGDARQDMIARMRGAAKEQLEILWASRNPELPLDSKREALTMASLIEKETGKKAEERPRVAGVFYNRLKIGMRLQSDPTVIYALTHGQRALERELTHADLESDSPYNTYVKTGLPPGPICNPGKASLMAALHPETNDFLYFVADGTGGHAFAKDLPDHNKNVNRWLKRTHP